jgi:erythromycin esterase-like protein
MEAVAYTGNQFMVGNQSLSLDALVAFLQIERANRISDQVEDYAEDLKAKNGQLAQIGQILDQVRDALATGADIPAETLQAAQQFLPDLTIPEGTQADEFKENLQASLETVRSQLTNETELDLIMLQQGLSKYNTAIQTATGTLKTLSDTESSVVRNI